MNFSKQSLQKKMLLSMIFGMMMTLSACSLVSVYKIDIPQGTPIAAKQLEQVQVGMSQNEVLYLLGSPAIRDTLNPKRWDYIYDYTAGTQGKKDKRPNIHHGQQYIKIYFDNAGLVQKIEH